MSQPDHASALTLTLEEDVLGNELSTEGRVNVRRRTLKSGIIVIANGANGTATYNCTVRNVSAAGVLLAAVESFRIPKNFDLICEGERRSCVIIWRETDKLGAHFV